MCDVFISYPRIQRSKVELIKAKLEALDLKVFFDLEGIDSGVSFPDVIDKALRASKAVLGCWTPEVFASKWCMIECRWAAKKDKLVAVAIEPFDEDDPPPDFVDTNYFDLTDFAGESTHEGWNRTLRSLSSHVGRELGSENSVPQPGQRRGGVQVTQQNPLREVVGRFLARHSRWSFSSTRIHALAQNQTAFGILGNYSVKEIRAELDSMVLDGMAKARLSKKGGTLFRLTDAGEEIFAEP